MNVPRDQVVAFAMTHNKMVLKLSAQLFPLMPGENEARLELMLPGQNGVWRLRRKFITRAGTRISNRELG